jgi:transcriptional regulator with XRE-family HTH domain
MFIQRLKEARAAKKLSQKKLSELLHVSQQAVGHWESGRSTPSPEMLRNISEVLDVSIDYLLGNEEISEQTKKPADGELSELSKNKKEILNLLEQVDPQKRDIVDLAVKALIQSIIDSQ